MILKDYDGNMYKSDSVLSMKLLDCHERKNEMLKFFKIHNRIPKPVFFIKIHKKYLKKMDSPVLRLKAWHNVDDSMLKSVRISAPNFRVWIEGLKIRPVAERIS